MSFPGGSQEEVKFYEEQCRLQDEHVSKLKSEIESLKAKLQTAEFFQNKWSAESEKLLKDNTELKAKNRYQEILIEEFENKVKELIKEREELKAKLEESGNSIYEEWADAKIKDLTKENTELKSKLSVQDWHDASELPTEEGYYAFSFDGIWAPIDLNLWDLKEAKLYTEELLKNPDYSNIKWKHITLPEGK
jgi:DNA repair exonuclease SbcCD ATPase subunit